MVNRTYAERTTALQNEVLALKSEKEKLANTIAVATKSVSVTLPMSSFDGWPIYSTQCVICTLTPDDTSTAFLSSAYIDTTTIGYKGDNSVRCTLEFLCLYASPAYAQYRFLVGSYEADYNDTSNWPSSLSYKLVFSATSDFALSASYKSFSFY